MGDLGEGFQFKETLGKLLSGGDGELGGEEGIKRDRLGGSFDEGGIARFRGREGEEGIIMDEEWEAVIGDLFIMDMELKNFIDELEGLDIIN